MDQKDSQPDCLTISGDFRFDTPLNFEEIVRSCFSNPERKNYPNFGRNAGLDDSMYCKNESPEYWIARLDPALAKEFNDARIMVLDPALLHNRPDVIKKDFAASIKASKWCGPYKHDFEEIYAFYTITEDGKNQYYTELELSFNTSQSQSLIFYCFKNASCIADEYRFDS